MIGSLGQDWFLSLAQVDQSFLGTARSRACTQLFSIVHALENPQRADLHRRGVGLGEMQGKNATNLAIKNVLLSYKLG